jgi:hypothetical protein
MACVWLVGSIVIGFLAAMISGEHGSIGTSAKKLSTNEQIGQLSRIL